MKSIVIAFAFIVASIPVKAQDDLQVDKLSRKKFAWLTQKKLDSLTGALDDRLMR